MCDSAATSVKRLRLLALALHQPFHIPGTHSEHCWLQIFKEQKERVLQLAFFFHLAFSPPLCSFKQIFMLSWTWRASPGPFSTGMGHLVLPASATQWWAIFLVPAAFLFAVGTFAPYPKKHVGFAWWKHRGFPSCDGSTFSVMGHKHGLKWWGILHVPPYKLPHAKRSPHFCQKAGHYCSVKT